MGHVAWTNPGNAAASDNVYATCVLAASQQSQILRATNFGFAIPSGATIDGILVEIERKASAGSVGTDWDGPILVKAGVAAGTHDTSGPYWPTADAYQSYGGATSKWGTSWSDTDINNSGFGVQMRGDMGASGGTLSVDHIRITVYYSSGAQATGAISLPFLSVSGTGKQTQAGTGAITLPFLAVAGTGKQISAAITGTATASIDESDIVAGGKTVIITLTDDTFVTDTPVTPVIESGDATLDGDNATTPANPWVMDTPALSIGDLIIAIVGWDDSTTNTGISLANGPNGETWTQIGSVVASASTEVRMTAYYTIATGSWSAGTINITPNANEQWTSCVLRVPAGEFDPTTPIGASATRSSSGTSETSVLAPAFSAGATDGGGRYIWAGSVDQDPQTTLAAGFTSIDSTDRGQVSLSVQSRDSAVTDSESISGGTRAIASDSWCSLGFVVRAPATAFEDARQDIIDGMDSAQSEANGWDAEVKGNQGVSGVVRTSSTVVTVTLDAQAAYNITANETITVTVPASALTGGSPIVGSPTFVVAYTTVIPGTGAIALPFLSVAGTGTQTIAATGAITLPFLSVAGTGTQAITGTGAIALPFVAVAGVGVAGAASATGAIVLPFISMAGTGVMQPSGTGAIILPFLVVAGTGTQTITATGAIVLPFLAVAGTGVMQPTGTGAITLPFLVVAGTGTQTIIYSATGALVLPFIVVSGIGVFGVLLPPVAGVATTTRALPAGTAQRAAGLPPGRGSLSRKPDAGSARGTL